MTDNVHQLTDRQPAKAGKPSQPVSPQQAVALLTSCLALVRPVGMTPDEVEDWLAVALGEVAEFPADILESACKTARRRCTHHSQIVPAVVDECRDLLDERAKDRGRLVQTPPAPRLPAPELTQDAIDAMPDKLVKIGLGCGYLRETADGKVVAA